MRSGNLSFMAGQGRPYQLAPVYAMAPMAFAPTAGVGESVRPQALAIGLQAPRPLRLALAHDFVARRAALRRKSRVAPGAAHA